MENAATNQKSAKPAEVMDTEMKVQGVVMSMRGCVRENNEDNFFFDGDFMQDDAVNEGVTIRATVSKKFHLFAICDGMGGLNGGERASSIGVHALGDMNIYMPAKSVERAIDIYATETCKKVYQDSLLMSEAGREGTTLAILYLADGLAHVANVGDSRVYLLRMGKLYQLSTDHSEVYQMMLNGELTREQMRKHPRGNVIGAYLGMEESRMPKPYVTHLSLPVCRGDRFLLCSDGLSDLLSHEEMRELIDKETDISLVASRLAWRAMEMGGKDNTTIMVLDMMGNMYPEPTAASVSMLYQEK